MERREAVKTKTPLDGERMGGSSGRKDNAGFHLDQTDRDHRESGGAEAAEDETDTRRLLSNYGCKQMQASQT